MSENSLADAWRRPSDVLLRLGHAARVRQVPLLMAGAIAFGAAVLIGRVESGWWHHDDGSLAHSAERVLNGELPHRDFAELYTGLLTFLNAGVFAVFGEDMFNLRIPLFVLFLAFVGCFFAIARRLVSPIWAFVATLAAVTWSVPVYPAPMPSWYLLFLTTFGMYAVIRYFETQRSRWLLVAGLAGGIGVAIKIVGIWFVIGATLALLVEPVIADPRRQLISRRHAGSVIGAGVVALSLATYVLSSQITSGDVAALFVPIAVLSGAVVLVGLRAWRTAETHNAWGTLRAGTIFLGSISVACPPLRDAVCRNEQRPRPHRWSPHRPAIAFRVRGVEHAEPSDAALGCSAACAARRTYETQPGTASHRRCRSRCSRDLPRHDGKRQLELPSVMEHRESTCPSRGGAGRRMVDGRSGR